MRTQYQCCFAAASDDSRKKRTYSFCEYFINQRCDSCIQTIVLILSKHSRALGYLDQSDIECLRRALRNALDVYSNDPQKQIATQLLIKQLNL